MGEVLGSAVTLSESHLSDEDAMALPLQHESMTLTQTLISGPDEKLNRRIPIVIMKESKLKAEDLAAFDHTGPIGISVGYEEGSKGKVLALAIVDENQGLLIELNGKKGNGWRNSTSNSKRGQARRLLEETVLCRAIAPLVGFDMAPLVLSICNSFGLVVSNAIDVQDTFSPDDRNELVTVKTAMGEGFIAMSPKERNIERLFTSRFYDPEERRCKVELASKAWLAQLLVAEFLPQEARETVRRIDLGKLDERKRELVVKLATDALRLGHTKSLETRHQVTEVSRDLEGNVAAKAMAYKHKFHSDKAGKIEVHNTRGTFTVQGTITKGAGRNGHITTSHNTVIDLASVQSVETFGRDRLTNAEQHRAAAVLRMLQGNLEAFETSPFITNIWFPEPDGLVWPPEWAKEKRSTRPASDNLGRQTPPPELPTLNGSQQKAVNNMLHHRKRLVIVQGPPGTGKTSVIGSCVAMAANKPIDGIWLIAQSNVAVKNIALKLQSIQFEGWKILVSKDFIHEWHEHLYDETLKAHMIVSTRFSQVHPKEEFKGCKVVLCTLSMLSNYHVKRFTQQVPLQLLIVDEASQIEIGNYFSVLENFSKTLRKICFIGDDKQLPPHGEEDLKTLQSIFEVPHLKNEVIFLNTQYRMPPQIGNIISSCVYDDQLGSNPLHKVPDTAPACYFIDISAGREETDGKGSWKNTLEKDAVIGLAQKLQDAEKKYKIITPYDAQTRLIENEMRETEGLMWEDTCFNVDAFQGNEEDFIIISLVRSRALGFLANLRRTNVMLTRCKQGMYIICNRSFLEGRGNDCLVGDFLEKMEEKFGSKIWATVDSIQV